ncbi:uncharacterized protein LOC5521517 isoform X2 [Nematostella vectensis]|uniref:uncharacterized protein LOC5521517 isoform X2 n=1 Tax=Nematostella vectensis TaxID=45351 RepID=UPI00138FA5DF|nr:uncharacterized protein LOC5521517 isoform X2 [Nematostella vectensis]
MRKGLEVRPSPVLGVEQPFGEAYSLYDSEGYQCNTNTMAEDAVTESSVYEPSYGSWEDDFQSLSPFGADWEMEQEFFKSDASCFDFESCKTQGPTLAELNDQRSLSPLINPEMERLHRIATRTEPEPSCFAGKKNANHSQTFANENANKNEEGEVFVECKKEGEMEKEYPSCKFANRESEVKVERTCLASLPVRTATTTTMVQNQDEPKTIELASCDLMKRILQENKFDVKSSVPIPKLVTPELKFQSYTDESEKSRGNFTVSRTQGNEENDQEFEPMEIHDDSGDEDVDSDDDYDDREGDSTAKIRKGRRSDTDDLSPNPRRLLEIGRELNRLNKVISDLKPIHSLPLNARNKSRKEKNKLASRACRLKKKAQHEANKLKLHGLELEQQRLIHVIEKVRSEIIHTSDGHVTPGSLSSKVESLVTSAVTRQ